VEKNKFDIIFIDHYGIDYLLETEVKKYCDDVMIISDIFDFNHYCDVFINYNCNDLQKVKKINLNDKTEYKIGVENIILNKKFIDSKKKNIFNKEIKNLVINMGGSDPSNFTFKILNIINDYIIKNNICVNIIIGKSNNHIQSIKDFILNNVNYNNYNNYNIQFDINYDDMIDLYLNCDLAIGTLSVTAYERLILNIPQICLKIVDNQLIQQLDEFNIVTIDNLLDKILDYNNIIDNYLRR
jgi:spore coat polysaccharide biosynthesis predicted glycosyltransferase SpsG